MSEAEEEFVGLDDCGMASFLEKFYRGWEGLLLKINNIQENFN